ncbi:MAG TPA: lysophospholipid acyltransferase family protein [Jatrophihabitans sp.]|nr:lysophospholipid acyltransferase family protein [Jatrophihabitans sp.]
MKGLVRDVRQVSRGWRWGRRPLVPRSAEEFMVVEPPGVFGTDWARTPAAKVLRELAQKAALEPIFRSQVRTRVEGLDVLTGLSGPVIFAANHASHLDTPLILLSLPDEWRRRTAVAAAADYFFDTWWRAVGSAVVFNTFPIDRRGGSLASTPSELLDEGWNLVIFPEGTRTHDGWLGRFQSGAAYLAVRHGLPVVPVAHRGTFAAMPRGRSWPARGRRQLTIRFGTPLRPESDDTPRTFAPRVRDAIGALLDEDRTDWWAARRRAVSGTTPDPAGPPIAAWRRVWEQTAPVEVETPRRAWN